MSTALDAYVTRALLRVCEADGRARGTAFRIHPSGVLLTCHHVVRDLGTVHVAEEGGQPVVGRCTSKDRFPAVDLAVIRTSLTGPALPIASHNQDQARWWTKGYGWQTNSVRTAVPVQGQLPGTLQGLSYGQYELGQVYALGAHSSFDGGVSGAPLLDPDSGVVTGVVNTLYRGSADLAGFALPFVESKMIPRIGKLLAKNLTAVPAWGQYLNKVAACDICERQVRPRLNSLEASQQLLRGINFPRHRLDSVVQSFMRSDAVLLPLYGPSGYGKTVQLASMAQAQRYPCVLLLGARVRGAERDLQDSLSAELEDVDVPFGRITPDLLAQALASGGKSLVVLLDGLNEGPRDLRRNLRDWLGSSCTWAADMRVKIVLSSRPELWRLGERHISRNFIWQDPRRAPASDLVGTEVGELSDAEADAALKAYGLMDRGIRRDDIRYPFMLRVYKELQRTSDIEGHLSRYHALELFVDSRCAAVAAALDGEVTNSRVRRVLRRLAAAMASSGDNHVTSDQLERAGAGVVGLEAALIDENVLIDIPEGTRFAFDQVADFLRAETVEPAAVADFAIEAIREGSDSLLAQTEFALTGLARRDPHSFVRAADRLLTFAGESNDRDLRRRCREAMRAPLSEISEPAAFFPQLQRWTELVAGGPAGFEARLISSLDLPAETRLSLLRTLLPGDYGRPAEKGEFEFYKRTGHWVLSYVINEVEVNPSRALPELANWLSDDRILRNSRASIRSIAKLMILHYADMAPSKLFDVLSSDPEKLFMLRMLGQARPDIARAQSERLIRRKDSRSIEAALVWAGGALETASDMITRNELLDVVNMTRQHGDSSTRLNALGVLLYNQETVRQVREDGFAAVIDGMLAPHYLRLAAWDDPAAVVPRLIEIAGAHQENLDSILLIVAELPLSEEVETALIDLLVDSHKRGQVSDYLFADILYNRLCLVAEEPAAPRLREVAFSMARDPSEELRDVINDYLADDVAGHGAHQLQVDLRAMYR